MDKRYAGYPTALVFEDVAGTRGTDKVEELLWGDLVDLQPEVSGDFVRVRVRTGEGSQRIFGWMKANSLIEEPLLEITFIDVGQGDGCVVITPDDRTIVIDAGKGDNMMRFLRWRFMFPNANRPKRIDAGVISHPDNDHYLGFRDIFNHEFLSFDTVFHNGLVERKGEEPLGPRTTSAPKVYTELVRDLSALRALLEVDAARPGRKEYPDMLRDALAANKSASFQMLSRDDGHMPRFEADKAVRIEVLGPVVETDSDGAVGLRRLGTDGETKNGHSVVLRLTYGSIRVLLGGDLNVPAEELLLETKLGRPLPTDDHEREKFVAEARTHFEVDIAKCCHHGSADFSSLFLEAVNPIATVISSGDDEAHSHPRAQTLGAIGRASRGLRPLIFSTELARSARDRVQEAAKDRRTLKALHRKVLAENDAKKRRKLQAAFNKQIDEAIQDSVQTYGAIYLRTDGEKAVLGHRFEVNRPGKMYDLSRLEAGPDGSLAFVSGHTED